MNERWTALREYLMQEAHEAWQTFNTAAENGERARADIFFARPEPYKAEPKGEEKNGEYAD